MPSRLGGTRSLAFPGLKVMEDIWLEIQMGQLTA